MTILNSLVNAEIELMLWRAILPWLQRVGAVRVLALSRAADDPFKTIALEPDLLSVMLISNVATAQINVIP